MKRRTIDPYLIRTAVLALIAAGITFGFFIFQGGGFFTVVDDFNDQQLTFATAVWNMLHSGDPGQWSWNVDLGASFVNAFAFYNLGSPFIWLSLLAPRGSFPYLAGFLYILKYVVAAVSSYLYMRLFVRKRQWCAVAALLYAFSGYQTTNLEFFHFHDVAALFPLLLLSLELAMRDKRYRPLFVLAVFFHCLLNYYFFVGQVVFLILYYVVRFARMPARQFLSGILSCALCWLLGIGMAAVLLLPSLVYMLGSSRAGSTLLLNDLSHGSSLLLYILKGLLLPGDSMRNCSAVLPQRWDSTSAYLPFFGLSLVFAYLARQGKSWLGRLLLILAGLSLLRLPSGVFLLFKEVNQRWWYMLVLLMALATARVLESREDYPVKKSALLYGALVAAFYLVVAFVPWDANGTSIVYYPSRFLLFVLIALAGPAALLLLELLKKASYRSILALTMCCCIATTGLTLHYYRRADPVPHWYQQRFKAGLQLETLDPQYRYNSTDNVLTLTGDGAGIGAFSSTIEESSKAFDAMFDLCSSNYSTFRSLVPGLPELLAGHYEITPEPGDEQVIGSVQVDDVTFCITQKPACPIGFAVDHMLTEAELMAYPMDQRAQALMQAAVIDESMWPALAGAVTHADAASLDTADLNANIRRTIDDRVGGFTRDSHGFACTTSYDRDRLVYFTVPWSTGWRATVDGEDAQVLYSGGMMALLVPQGEHSIRFTYHTPGLRLGIAVSAVSFAVFFLLLAARALHGRAAKRRAS